MEINADRSERAVILPKDYNWTAAPVEGVHRVMLDRIGIEDAVATSLVCYEPDSEFTAHEHVGGEEILVLDGTFADEHGEYPAGSYIRNPIGSSHTPKVGSEGALIFVKLQQIDERDTRQCCIDTASSAWQPGSAPGLEVMPLHDFEGEHVALVKWQPNTEFNEHVHTGGEEIFVIQGTFYDEHGRYPAGSWIRSPHMSRHKPYTRDDGALIYVKIGHL